MLPRSIFTLFNILLLLFSPSISCSTKMGKQSKAKKQEHVGKGKVTPVQIAFIVDRYLSDNNYIQTRSNFRSEASHLIAKSPVQEAPKSLLSLGAILDEYITLKEQKVLVDQERLRLEQEKFRVQNLLSGMQEAMNAYNSTGSNVITPPPPLPPPSASAAMTPQAELAVGRPAGYYPMYNTPAMMSTSRPSNTRKVSTHLSTPITNQVPTKRKEIKDISDGAGASKRTRRSSTQSKDGNSTSESEKEGDTLDLDFSSLDTLGLDFNLSDFLLDFDIGGDLASSSRQELVSSPDTCSGSPLTSGNIEMGTTQITSEYSSTMAGLIGDTNMNLAGADSVSAMRSVTKCITIVSPVKNQRMNSAQSNYLIGHD
ncbi:uncharacterized protein LOC121798360 isoform X3 [Salvia splendens]|uniref:uncharacterized protein LOC121798360 isoform X3 n=1 Tax=Salvia splendens TaxID=180675 RepID=UPI001C260D63|nr:uncharacterized protein LOC121798360 isoform X3 [Salvia splendens]